MWSKWSKRFGIAQGSRLALILGAIALVGLLAAACGGDDEAVAAPTAAPVVAAAATAVTVPKPAAVKDSVRVAFRSGTSFLSDIYPIGAAAFTVQRAAFDSLVTADVENDQIVPLLALGWEVLDPTTFRVKLRPNVKFHNGKPLGADDVAFWITQLLDPALAFRSSHPNLTGAVVVDELTVDIKHKGGYGMLPMLTVLSPLDKETQLEIGEEAYRLNPIGTGPFKVVEWAADDYAFLERNPDYWGDNAKLENIRFTLVGEIATKVAMLYAGEADIIDNVPPHLVEQIAKSDDLEIRTAGTMRAYFITVNTFAPPFDDVRVRLAVAHAINTPLIIEKLFAGKGKQLVSIGARSTQYYNTSLQPIPYDPERAKQLLAEAGYPDGIEVGFDAFSGMLLNDKQAAEAYANQLAEVGIKTDFWAPEWGTFWTKWLAKESEISYMTCGNIRYSAVFCHNRHFNSMSRGIYYNSPEMDDLLNAALAASDPADQKAAMWAVQAFVNENVPYIPTFELDQIFAVNKDLKWVPDADERIYLHKAEWTK
jgi:peptide/nickel transport system substrate-binding protein